MLESAKLYELKARTMFARVDNVFSPEAVFDDDDDDDSNSSEDSTDESDYL